MRIVSADDIQNALTYRALIDALDDAFRSDIVVPVRHHHTIETGGTDATLLLMPAWNEGDERYIGCKIVTVFPDNAKLQRPSVYGQYLLLSGATGEPLAMMDGRALTAWRTACASALAARYLAREDAAHLVMVGAGALAPYLIRAHLSVRPIKRVTLWNRTRARAVSLGFGIAVAGIEVDIAETIEEAVREADIVSCATLAAQPLIHGDWLKKGAHLDLVGGFTPKMREADDQAVKRSRIFVDTRAGATKEAGDIAVPLKKKVIDAKAIKGDLFDLARGKVKGRTSESQITLFKSVGTAIEDIAAAMLVWKSLSA
ncbi:ornithine cyclodeaminase family protein [Pseudorhodoplanes sp.]|uniref:ornithine cyclodeaminase family protein n=1 Tax=Pseudorhodoplanes sp. TaxID=1934341 RepID=UPI002BD97913|nr:ornithine cyclodeaminase family protein [Pseudorhodoplanes sp.]HWV53902.1 ornithine cyclodeaminase family protein [Pseudorhodoplanes sp.]